MANSEIKLKLVIDEKGGIASLNLTDDNIEKIIRSVNRFNQESKTAFASFADKMTNVRNSLQGLRESYEVFRAVFSKPVQLAVEFEQAKTAFSVLLGSTKQAEDRIRALAEFAKTTPFQFTEVVDASRQLEVLTNGALSTGKGLRLVGDVAAGTGVKINELSMWFGRLYDGIQSGRPVGEALMRLQELGVISGETRGKLEELEKSGRLSAEGWAVVTDAVSRYNGMMEKQSETLGGKLSNLEDSVAQLQTVIGGTIGTAISPLVDGLNKVLGSIYNLSPEISGLIGTAVMLTAAYTGLSAAGLLPVIKNLMTMGPTLQSLKVQKLENIIMTRAMTAAEQAEALAAYEAAVATKGFFASLGPIGWAMLAMSALIAVVGLLPESIDEASMSQQKFNEKLQQMNTEDLHEKTKKLQDDVVKLQDEYTLATEYITRLQNKQYEGRNIRDQIASDETKIASLQEYQYELQEKIRQKKEAQYAVTKRLQELEAQRTREIKDIEKDLETGAIADKRAKARKEILDWEKETRLKIDQARKDGIIKSQEEYLNTLKNLEKTKENKLKDVTPRSSSKSSAAESKADNLYDNLTDDVAKENEKALEKTQKSIEKYFDEQVEMTVEKNNQMKEIEKEYQDTKISQMDEGIAKERAELEQWYSEQKDKYKNNADALIVLKQTYELKLGKIKSSAKQSDSPDDKAAQKQVDYMDEGTGKQRSQIEADYAKERAEIQSLELSAVIDKNGNIISAEQQKNSLLIALSRKRQRALAKVDEQEARQKLAVTQQLLGNVASLFGKHTMAYKTLAVANATINTYEAATAAYKSAAEIPIAGPALAPIAAAAAIAAGLANVQNIISTETPSMPGYFTGGYTGDGGKYDPAGIVHKGEYVVKKEMTARYRPYLELINSGQVKSGYSDNPLVTMQSNALQRYNPELMSVLRNLNGSFENYARKKTPAVIGERENKRAIREALNTDRKRRG